MPISFGTYNICNGRNGVLELALIGTSHANMDMGIFQDTKLTNGVYTCGSVGSSVVTTDAPSRHRGGVTFFVPAVTAICGRGHPSVWAQRCQLSTRDGVVAMVHHRVLTRPYGTLAKEFFVTALRERPRGAKLLVAGDLNIKLSEPQGYWRG